MGFTRLNNADLISIEHTYVQTVDTIMQNATEKLTPKSSAEQIKMIHYIEVM